MSTGSWYPSNWRENGGERPSMRTVWSRTLRCRRHRAVMGHIQELRTDKACRVPQVGIAGADFVQFPWAKHGQADQSLVNLDVPILPVGPRTQAPGPSTSTSHRSQSGESDVAAAPYPVSSAARSRRPRWIGGAQRAGAALGERIQAR